MARKKKTAVKKKPVIKNMVKDDAVSVGDVCYFLSADNTIRMGEIIQILLKDDSGPAIRVQCQVNGSYHAVPIRLAAWDQKSLKGMKWDIKADLKRHINDN
jgi:hypothetical protein